MKECIIIGGGIVGLCTAYYLHLEGHKVTIIDQSSMDAGASYVNAGYLTPSHIIPLAAPGAVKQGIKWMFDKASPLYIKPRLEQHFIQWAWAFNKSCTARNVARCSTAIKDINLFSSELYHALLQQEEFSFHLEKKGLLMVCQTEQLFEEELHTATLARTEGLGVQTLTPAELRSIEPNVAMTTIGALHYDCDSHTTPHIFMQQMKAFLTKVGITFIKNEKITDLTTRQGRITAIQSSTNTYTADEYILAAGSWSHHLSKKLGIKLLLEAGKGYAINTSRTTGISIPTILCEAKVAVTPMIGHTRFAGTMEIAGINHSINPTRVQAIARAAQRYYPDIQLSTTEQEQASCGLRPVSPDGMPYIGRSAACTNLTIATGHAMMGWSLGPATGKLVSEIITDQKITLPIDLYHPDRKF